MRVEGGGWIDVWNGERKRRGMCCQGSLDGSRLEN